VHVAADAPGAAPLPVQVGQRSRTGNSISFSVPRTASSNAIRRSYRVRAGQRTPSTGPTGLAAEEGVEDVPEARGAGAEAVEPGLCRAEPGPPEHVVRLPALGIGEDLVRLVDLLEAIVRLVGLVDIGVPRLGELAEGALDVRVARATGNAEHVVVVAFGRHATSKDT
jgi:hypothetical protein